MKRLICAGLLACLAGPSYAATLVHNVRGYTMNDGALLRFAALEYEAGKVTRLYPDAATAKASGADERIDGGGATLLPGLIDAHGHVSSLGLALKKVDLVGAASEQDALERVAEFAQRQGEGWLLGRGWNQVLWPGKAFPSRTALDRVTGDRPAAFNRVDGHALWVNTAALRAAGIDDSTPDPEGGQIVRDAQGRATGVLIDNAMGSVFKAIPAASDEETASLLVHAMEALAAEGLTSVHDARTSAQEVRVLQALRKEGRLPVRFYAMLDVLNPDNNQYLSQGPMIDPEHLLDIRAVKISADGALGSRGAALFEDYSDAPGQRGLLLLNDQELQHHILRAMRAGYQVNTHAIGDRANDRVLTFYENLIKREDSRALRHRIEHAQILRVADIPRLAASGIIASIQPTHATSDMNMAGDRLGEARLAGAYAWRQLLDSGAHMAGGSDFPVEPANPFFGLHAAITRQSHANAPPEGWLPREKLSRRVALSLFTEFAAYAAHQEAAIGRLLPGYYADFILVRDDYFEVPEEGIWKNVVLGTWVAGRQVYAADAVASGDQP